MIQGARNSHKGRTDPPGSGHQRFTETIEELTGRNVVAFLSQAHVEPDITMEIFFIDGPLAGFGTLELLELE